MVYYLVPIYLSRRDGRHGRPAPRELNHYESNQTACNHIDSTRILVKLIINAYDSKAQEWIAWLTNFYIEMSGIQ